MSGMRDREGRALRTALVDLFATPIDQSVDDADFDRMARRVFAWQYRHNAPYSAFCQRRGLTPATVEHWTEIPAVPTAAFREVALVAGPVHEAAAVFRTSGTTHGPARRGIHYIPDLALYHAALIPNFAACVLPDGARLRMLSIIPSAADLPDSSLSHMVATVIDRLGADGSGYFATATDGIDHAALHTALRAAEADGEPVCLLGTSFAFVHWLDRLAQCDERYRLPAGSRLMDTGGYKGRSRTVSPAAMRTLYADFLGIPDAYCVNEYGMTELCSQFYDATLRDTVLGRPHAQHRLRIVPPWVRTRVVDPESLRPVPDGVTGLLQHFDLANAGSVSAVQTEDMGSAAGTRFELIGRAPGATPRGCSIAMDVLLDAIAERQRP
jgi:hypothetical protein